jgi:succinate dehydrogenase/fumarate reductase iron-sulfur protein
VRFSIYRYNPETDQKPYMQKYELDIDAGNMMLLDAILLIKAQDESLSVRRSCREGVCGSDAMNINGRNGLRHAAGRTETADRTAALAGVAGGARSGGGHEPVLQAVPLDQALPDQQ